MKNVRRVYDIETIESKKSEFSHSINLTKEFPQLDYKELVVRLYDFFGETDFEPLQFKTKFSNVTLAYKQDCAFYQIRNPFGRKPFLSFHYNDEALYTKLEIFLKK